MSTIGLPEILHRAGNLTLLKLDCEGAEYDILVSGDENVYAKIQQIRLAYHTGAEQLIDNHLASTALSNVILKLTRQFLVACVWKGSVKRSTGVPAQPLTFCSDSRSGGILRALEFTQ